MNIEAPLYSSPSYNQPLPSFGGPRAEFKTTLLSAARFFDLRVIGQVSSTYLLLESDNGLVVIDQHAAHERVMYEKLRAQKKLMVSTPLLLPITMEIDFASMSLFEEHSQEIMSLGIEAEKFGDRTIIVRGLPDFMNNVDVKALLKDILSDLSTHGQSTTTENMAHHLFATMACHSSIRAGQRLSGQEIEALLAELDTTDFAAHCPHGRPIVKSFP